MRGSTVAVALPHPETGAAMRVKRSLVAAVVVLASAGTGYVGSRIWPLSAFSGPAMHLAATGSTSSSEPDSGKGAPHLASGVPKPAAATDPSASVSLASHPQPVETASLPEKARIEVRGASTSSPDSSVAVLYRTPAGQADEDGRSAPKTSRDAGKNERTATRRSAASAPRIARGQGSSGAQSSVVEFAPNPRPNQASRDFLASPSRN
jgi:hypothetical protein